MLSRPIRIPGLDDLENHVEKELKKLQDTDVFPPIVLRTTL